MNYFKKLLVACFLITSSSIVSGVHAEERKTITTTGSGTIKVIPDEVVITLGIETHDTQLKNAKEQNDRRIKAVIRVAKKYGIKEKHIQTDYLQIEPRYHRQHTKADFIGYFVRKTLAIKLRDVSAFDNLLSDVLDDETATNYVHGIQFNTTELRKYKDQARVLAVRAAKEKAELLATELGQNVGQPLNIQEHNTGWHSGHTWWGGRSGFQGMQNAIQTGGTSASSATGDSTIALGQIEINSMVSITFDLK